MANVVSLKKLKTKTFNNLGENFQGKSSKGEELLINNYYMEKNGHPFFGVSGEFHFSRMDDNRWEDELIKMKLCGLNTVSTYVFWNHHEEEEGIFDFTGRRNLKKFIELCEKHELYVILRIGPFDHGEVRNGGLPDWLYGKPFDVRTTNPEFLRYVRRLYSRIGNEVTGKFFKDGGPIIGVQLDNEYMHSCAPWEMTTGISNEWAPSGKEGNAYLLKLKEIAIEAGIIPVFYTCTGWGGAATPDSMLPLWGGYAYRPWLFYSYTGEHPATEEYVYQDFHNNDVVCTNDFKPAYKPEERPYACCEMGGGMMCSYYYRFQLPYKSVDAMANIKLASGCNFLGYYMFQGGSNPLGRHGGFLNEGQVPKVSYDYQAALGEFGQVRESYRRLKSLHYFVTCFEQRLCGLQTVLPEGASDIKSTDMETLRYAVRTDGKRGFVFINNFQDHANMPNRENEEITLQLENETVKFKFAIAADENAIMPFHFDMDGIDLVHATAQPLLRIEPNGNVTYVFMIPDGMKGHFLFENGCLINGKEVSEYEVNKEVDLFKVTKNDTNVNILAISRDMANQMFRVKEDSLIFTNDALLEDRQRLRVETTSAETEIYVYPKESMNIKGNKVTDFEWNTVLDCYRLSTAEKNIPVEIKQVGENRYQLSLQKNFMEELKDVRLQINYRGDIGHAFIDGRMINDNFCNDAVWEIGLKEYTKEIEEKGVTLYITPLKEGVNVNVESAMAARVEEVDRYIVSLDSVNAQPVYEIALN